MGSGSQGLLQWSLQDIQNLYYHPDMGGAVSVFTDPPPKNNSSPNLGIGTNGTTSLPNATTATTLGCGCTTGQ